MNTMDERNDTDPLGLSELPLLEPEGDGWGEIRQALEADQASGQQRRRVFGWVAMQAVLYRLVPCGNIGYGPSRIDGGESLAYRTNGEYYAYLLSKQ